MRGVHKCWAWVIWIVGAVIPLSLSAKMGSAEAGALLTYGSISFGFNMACIGFIYNSGYARELYNKVSSKGRRISAVRTYFFASGMTSMAVVSLIIYAPILEKIASLITKAIFDNDCVETINMLWSAAVYATMSVNLFLLFLLLRFVLNGMVKSARNHRPSEEGRERR